MIQEHGNKFYATARAYVVENDSDMPRDLAFSIADKKANHSFLYVAGRYVQGNNINRNGQYWTFDDLTRGEASIRHTPVNLLHDWRNPVGSIIETKLIQREEAVEGSEKRLLPEVQALGAVWAANFPEVADRIKSAHALKSLWWSMECEAESKQCLTCEKIFPYRAAAHEVCEHLGSSKTAPRRFINPTFLGGGLIFPPDSPGWKDAEVTDLAKEFTEHDLERVLAHKSEMSVTDWERMMGAIV